MWCSPVSASASISLILSAVLIGPGSIWNPSRGPSSWISTCVGRSLMVLLLGESPTRNKLDHVNVLFVIPAKSGNPGYRGPAVPALDPRFRGGDEFSIDITQAISGRTVRMGGDPWRLGVN